MGRKRVISIIIIMILMVGTGVLYVNLKFNKPYKVAKEIIKAAQNNENESIYLIDSNTWNDIKAKSKFRYIEERLGWKEFKSQINSDKNNINFKSEHPFWYKLFNFNMDSVAMDLYIKNGISKDKWRLDVSGDN
ncbi:hypothetical protein [Dethiothermospora halolimnae]|uniref:hypothetical protein n=1 Tax=Dethiothermospora halolimnae TaxID=3114390 RepID=UPI003CCB7951